mmetsp:Transcript_36299/g.85146  ORF Transcript_36299/g.85146 Transcript_36299/m.85146 type:complete len:134 (+) Transcript_36299:84-485(+)
MQASKASLVAAAAAATSLLLLTILLAGKDAGSQRVGLVGVPLSLTPSNRVAVKVQQLAAGMVKKNKEGYNTYREMCVKGCRREGADFPEEICGPGLLAKGWLDYSRGCEEGPEEKKKCKLSKVYCNGRYHASI